VSRAEGLRDAFEQRFGAPPTHLSRAPGRVTLIGEHIDYNDLPVLPMALQREVRLVLRPRDDSRVVLHNTAPEFESIEFEVAPRLEPERPGHWGNYVKGPADELARRFAVWRGFDGLVDSDLPVASGLGSSSAVVCAVGLALSRLNEVEVELGGFAEIMADAERYTGTRGGGMDQAVSLDARPGAAARVSFKPLRVRHVSVPEHWRFVIADTGVRAEKSGAVQKAYNLRRDECEMAFSAVRARIERDEPGRMPPSGYPELLRTRGLDQVLALGEAALGGNLLRRFRHVVTEARRVDEAADYMLGADLASFGTLMDASHGSLRSDYHVSSAELDELVAIAHEGGASGARLTGAGFGGCIVALAGRAEADRVLEALRADYYEPRGMTEGIDDRAFIAVPSAGASFGPT
jgi:galactokinase